MSSFGKQPGKGEKIPPLCFELGLDYDDLGSRRRKANLQELIGYAERHGRLPDLVELTRQHRPLRF